MQVDSVVMNVVNELTVRKQRYTKEQTALCNQAANLITELQEDNEVLVSVWWSVSKNNQVIQCVTSSDQGMHSESPVVYKHWTFEVVNGKPVLFYKYELDGLKTVFDVFATDDINTCLLWTYDNNRRSVISLIHKNDTANFHRQTIQSSTIKSIKCFEVSDNNQHIVLAIESENDDDSEGLVLFFSKNQESWTHKSIKYPAYKVEFVNEDDVDVIFHSNIGRREYQFKTGSMNLFINKTYRIKES